VAPLINVVHVASFTQRRKRGSGVLVDEWLYDVALLRADIASIDPEKVDSVAMVTAARGRIDARADAKLAAIDPPEWGPDLVTG